jgi:uncharacterized membrane protein
MNRHEYMARLEAELAGIPGGERADALAYYDEYFDEAGPQNEEKAIEELGSPECAAEQIKADFAAKGAGHSGESAAEKKTSAIWWVILGIFALPVALPVAILLCVLLLVSLTVAAALIITFFAVAAAGFVYGTAAIVAGVSAVFINLPTGLFYTGVGAFSIGLALLVCLLIRALVRALTNGVRRFFNWIRRHGRRNPGKVRAKEGGRLEYE